MGPIQKFSVKCEYEIQLQSEDEEFSALSKQYCFN